MLRLGLIILAASSGLAQVPVDDRAILDAGRRNALAFVATLPDFICDQSIRRFRTPTNADAWRQTDLLLVKVKFVTGKEVYQLVSIDNRPTDESYESVLGARSTGEFGSWLDAIFNPATAAEFEVDGNQSISGRAAAVFAYKVAREHSHYDVRNFIGLHVQTVAVAYHGHVYIDLATSQVIRLEIQADGIPAEFPLRSSSVLLEYGFSEIGGRQYLVPSYAETRVSNSRFEFRNEIEFGGYRKFVAETSVVFGDGKRSARAEVSDKPAISTESTEKLARQNDAPVFPRPPEPSIAQRRDNKLVTFEVVALDDRGQPVRGLTAEDFRIQEQGRYFRVSVCRASDAAAEPEPPALASMEYSNRLSAAAPSGVRVILFDTLNPIDPRFARNQLARALREYSYDDYLYLYFLTAQGLQAVRGIPHLSGLTEPITQMDKIDLDRAYDTALKANVDSYGFDPNDMAYRSLRSLASHLAAFPGRKSIIWISRGVEISNASIRPEYTRDYSRLFAETAVAMQRDKVSIYPVGDARVEIGSQSMGVLGEVAAATGGRANLNIDVAAAIKSAMADSGLTYTVGFIPDTLDDRVHKVRITSRRTGVHLLAPASYQAEARRAAPTERERMAVENAAFSRLESADIGLQATMQRDRQNPDVHHFRIRMNAHDLRMYPDDDGKRFEGDLSITMVAYDGAGRASASETTGYLFHLDAARHDAALRGGLNISVEHAVRAPAEKVRLIVFDRYSDAAGSVTIPLAAQQITWDPDEVRSTNHDYELPSSLTLTVQSNLVEVGAVVRDAHGNVVAGLQQSDFRIFDDGQERAISAFSVEKSPPKSDGAADRAEPVASSARRSVILFFDDLSTATGDLGHGKLAARRFVAQALAPGDRVSVVTSSSAGFLDFTQDTSKVLDSIAKISSHQNVGENGITNCPRITPAQAYWIVNNDTVAERAAMEEQWICDGKPQMPISQLKPQVDAQAEATWSQAKASSQATLAAIAAALDGLSGTPGTRMLVLVSSGFLANTLDADEDRVVDRALRANIVIHSLDAKGLYSDTARSGGVRGPDLPLSTFIFEQTSAGSDRLFENGAMAALAEGTGGLLLHNNNDLDAGLRSLIPEVTYRLAFSPPSMIDNGKYHSLKVRLTGGGPNHVLARRGYFISPAAKPSDSAREPLRDIDREAAASDARRDLPVRIVTEPAPNQLRVTVIVDVRGLKFAQQAGRRDQTLSFVAVLFHDNGEFVSGKEGEMKLSLKDATFQKFAETGVSTQVSIETAPGAYRLRCVVQDSDGRITSSTSTIQIQ